MLNEHAIHGLMYVDDAMLYEQPTGHVIRTVNWAQSLPVEQRPVFTQVDSLAQWVASQGLSMQDVIAFGDNYNDLSMLEAAGTGIAMGNAVEEVKARANMVIGENKTTSIADYINRHLL